MWDTSYKRRGYRRTWANETRDRVAVGYNVSVTTYERFTARIPKMRSWNSVVKKPEIRDVYFLREFSLARLGELKQPLECNFIPFLL